MTKDQLFSGESKNIEYKVTVPDKSEKYMKTVVAFANGRGGRIVFGIDDKTLNIVGIDTDIVYKTMDAITNAISDACEPTIRPDVALQTVNDKIVIVVEIFQVHSARIILSHREWSRVLMYVYPVLPDMSRDIC